LYTVTNYNKYLVAWIKQSGQNVTHAQKLH